MDYTSIHVYGHLLSDDILHTIETDRNMVGNRDIDFVDLDTGVQEAIDYAWTALRASWGFYLTRSGANDPYGTRRSREFMEQLLLLFGYHPQRQQSYVESDSGTTHDITWLCPDVDNLPVIVKGDRTGNAEMDARERCSLDFRVKGNRRDKSAHATMLEYLNNTEHIYGIIANGPTLRLIRNSGQLVKLTYIEFDLRRMLEEDKYAEFCLMFRILHASRFKSTGDEQSVIERYFNLSIESGNRIRAGLSEAAQKAMSFVGNAALTNTANHALRDALASGDLSTETFNKELMHFIYRILSLFIIEDRNLVYDGDSEQIIRWKEIYSRYYAASRFRTLSELSYVRDGRHSDMWTGLMETFRLFEDGDFGGKLGIKPLGGKLFDPDTLHWLKQCVITNDAVFDAFRSLNVFVDEKGLTVKINYSSLDVEEFGSVYEGILEKRPVIVQGSETTPWSFDYTGGLDRQSTSSYYTRPDLVQSLIRTTLEPVIKEKISKLATPEEKVRALLDMKVCDAASGSGHIVLAMARTIAWYVCSIRTGEDNPASMDYRRALHEVIQRCVYAVDYNPDAVELCKVVLWIEGYCAGKPLSFLDHHIRCGNSVVGVADLDMLLKGVPDKAFNGDKEALKTLKKLNRKTIDDAKALRDDAAQRGIQVSLFSEEYNITRIENEQISLAEEVSQINAMPENTLHEQRTKQWRWEVLMRSPRVESLRRACDIYVDAFYHQFEMTDIQMAAESGSTRLPDFPYTATVYQALEEIKQLEHPDPHYVPLTDEFKRQVAEVSAKNRFFHWCVEFPAVFANGGGFDVMCGNPPWDKIKVEDKKWFESHGRMDIVNAGTASQRKKAIEQLPDTNPVLYAEYKEALADAEAMSRFVRFSGRFPLTATGDIDLYPMFAELCLQFSREAWGLVLPTGIAVNDSNKAFFSKLVDENRLISLYSFENEEKIFQSIAHDAKFCLVTAGLELEHSRVVTGGFYLRRLDQILDPHRIYHFKTADFSLFNPNTKSCPVFRTVEDAELTAKIYRKCGHILVNETTGENPWEIKFARMFDMSNDSHLFRTYQQMTEAGAVLNGNRFTLPDGTVYVPLYEGKMIGIYNHHYATWPTTDERPNAIDAPAIEDLKNTASCIMPWFWLPLNDVSDHFTKVDKDGNIMWKWNHSWNIAYRGISKSTEVRTFIVSAIPDTDFVGVGHSSTLLFEERGAMPGSILIGILSSLPFDYIVRQKLGGNNVSTFIVKQFPILAPDQIPDNTKWEMAKRVIELTYFNHDMDAWAEELWKEMTDEQRVEMPNVGRKEPFIFDPDRRAILQAELDAIVAHLFGLTTDELRYILDPEDICGSGCINETFRVLKERELREYGEYRTRRLVLDAWRRFNYYN